MQHDLNELLATVMQIAREKYDGHFAIFGFTGAFKVGFYTPDLLTGEGDDEVYVRPGFATLEAALLDLIAHPTAFGDDPKQEELPHD